MTTIRNSGGPTKETPQQTDKPPENKTKQKKSEGKTEKSELLLSPEHRRSLQQRIQRKPVQMENWSHLILMMRGLLLKLGLWYGMPNSGKGEDTKNPTQKKKEKKSKIWRQKMEGDKNSTNKMNLMNREKTQMGLEIGIGERERQDEMLPRERGAKEKREIERKGESFILLYEPSLSFLGIVYKGGNLFFVIRERKRKEKAIVPVSTQLNK